MFFGSLTPVEQDHLIGAFRFEPGRCSEVTVIERMLTNLASVDSSLCEQVVSNRGMTPPTGVQSDEDLTSPALSMLPPEPGPIDGREVARLIGDETTPDVVDAWRAAADPAGVEIVAVGPRFGVLAGGAEADRTVHTTSSVEYDGVVLAAEAHEGLTMFVQEAYRHHKTVGAIDEAMLGPLGVAQSAPGVESDPATFMVAMGWHRHWDRPGLGEGAPVILRRAATGWSPPPLTRRSHVGVG